MMRTSVSGMNAQTSRLGTVADNIANSSTAGYKRATTEFSSLILDSGSSDYNSGSVESKVRYMISEKGSFLPTNSPTDLAVSGAGFFIVEGGDNEYFMTRAGSFVKDPNGYLVNAAGYRLAGYSLAQGDPPIVVNGTAGLEPVNVGSLTLQATPSTSGIFSVNFPSNWDAVDPAKLPSANAADSAPSTDPDDPNKAAKSSLVTYDYLGNEVTIDIYMAKTADNTWEVSVYNRADAAPGGGFPYGAAGDPPLATATLVFDPTSGKLTSTSDDSVSVNIPGGATLELDLSGSSQLAHAYDPIDVDVNGNPPSEVDHVEVSSDGYVFAVFENGARIATHRIPLATVSSPDNLDPVAGNAYVPSNNSGDIQIGFAGDGGNFGTISAFNLEQSNVDLASELTSMIEAERNYTANSKVFQTGADLMETLVNLVR
jgi:flagellar hook protein FlgE